jgi:arylsulfatase A-like enzyme
MRLPWTVSNIDLAPTILELLGAPAEARFRGRSLMPLIRGNDSGDRPCFGETGKRFHPENRRREVDGPAGKWRWLREGRFKMFYVPRATGPSDLRLHDLETDPGEYDDVKADHAEVARSFRDRLEAWVEEDMGAEEEGEISEEELEQLRSLGYIN